MILEKSELHNDQALLKNVAWGTCFEFDKQYYLAVEQENFKDSLTRDYIVAIELQSGDTRSFDKNILVTTFPGTFVTLRR